ncbi:MAG: HAMP domain-containing histidine kinase, partial [Kofleriaceae bacterium]|nr:HAMP domain-containing histidine kinase [Kofleriaceae bacterium]
SFLEYARRAEPSLVSTGLHGLVEEVVDLEAALARDLSVEIVVELEPVFCRADPEQLRRAILNLLQNAIQAGAGSDKAVTLKSWRAKDTSYFSVSNFGSCISEDAREHLFEPFYTTKEKGTGLGLAFVHEIISDHGGTITVTSNDVDGTCFTISLESAGDQEPEVEKQ